MSDLKILVEAAAAVPQAKSWFFDAQVFWGGLLALCGASLTAWKIHEGTKFEREKIETEHALLKFAVAAALQSEISMNAKEFLKIADNHKELLYRVSKKRTKAPIHKDFYEKTFYELHQAQLGILGTTACQKTLRCYRNARNRIDWVIKHRAKIVHEWEIEGNYPAGLLEGLKSDIVAFYQASAALGEITGEKLSDEEDFNHIRKFLENNLGN